MDRTVCIKGTGEVSAKPDFVHISLRISAEDRDYEKANALVVQKTENLRKAVVAVGLKAEDLVTSDFHVNARHKNVSDAHGTYRQEFVGYSCNHSLKLGFAFNGKTLGGVLNALNGCDVCPDINIHFTVKDAKALSEKALEEAYADAEKKAEILAKASGATLGEVIKMDCGVQPGTDAYSPTTFGVARDACLVADMDINPDEIRISEEVTVTWRII